MGKIIKREIEYSGGGGGSGDVSFEIDKLNDYGTIADSNTGDHIIFNASDTGALNVIMANPGTYYKEVVLATKGYVDNAIATVQIPEMTAAQLNEIWDYVF